MKISLRPFALWFIAVTILFSGFFARTAAAADDAVISDSAIQQIRALEQEKASRAAVHRRLDSQFVYQLRQSRNQPAAAGVTNLRPSVKFEADGRILVDIDGEVTPALLALINQSGGTVVSSFPRFKAVRALVPLNQIENIAGSTGVKFVGPAREAHTHSGIYTSEGDVTHRAGFARNNFGATGQGIKIGVLSDGIGYLANSQATGDLPNVTVLPGQDGNGGGEGTAMLEIIHDLAPGAQLFFATAFNGEASFAQNILNLRSNGCDIIVDDVFYYDESPFQDGIIAQAVSSVVAGGALYFSSAGNEGNLKHDTSGTWEGDFADAGQASPPVNVGGGRVHSFGGASYNTVLSSGSGYVTLFWSDPLGASASDYDLFVLDSSGTYVVSSSVNLQDGTQDPYEIAYASSGNRIVVVKSSGDARFIHLAVLGGTLSIKTAGATKGHSAVPGALSVAAVSASTSFPNPFSGGGINPVEAFSADGPRHVFFNPDGTSITPGNLLSGGGTLRQKPDIAAADGVITSVPGFQPFYGTSAAAPHAAAIAALIWSYDPALTPSQVRATLTGTALDIEVSGPDANSGAGLVMADTALQLLPTRPVMVGGTSALLSESCPNSVLDPGEVVTISFSVTNVGTAATSNLLATLLPTGLVVSPGAPQSYGTLAPHGGTDTRNFTFTVAGSCGDSNEVTLHLQDGPRDLGNVTFGFRIGTKRFPLVENFDSVTPPTFPPGWTITISGPGNPWNTVSFNADGYPNSAYVPDPGVVSDKSLISPSFPVATSTAQLTFRHYMYTYNYGYDGGVLEISTNGGAFNDIIAAGGSFVTNGYFATIYSGYSNAISGRQAWTGYIGGFITTIVNLPATAAGNNIRLRWRFSSSNFGGGDGWYVDTISLFDGYACCGTLSNDLVVSASASPSPVVIGGKVSYAIYVQNTGPSSASGVTVTNLLPNGVGFFSAALSQGSFTNSGQAVICNLGSLAGGDIALVQITGVASNAGTITNLITVGRTDPDATLANNSAAAVATVILPSVSIAGVSLFEGNSGTNNAVFTVSLSPTPALPVTVHYATTNQSATAGSDYLAVSGILNFGPGEASKTISVPILGDTLNEADETFEVDLSAPTGAQLATAQAIGTILNDDPLPKLSITDATVVEGDVGTTNAVFNVSLAGATEQLVAVNFYTEDGTASAGDDYDGTSGTIYFNPGVTNQTIVVVVHSDLAVEPDETFHVILNSPSNGKIARSTGIGTILNDDGLPGNLHHFAWSAISSPQSNGLPIAVTVSALDYSNNPAVNFPGPATLQAFGQIGTKTNSFFGNTNYYVTGNTGQTYGYSFVPSANLTVTHFRHYSGNKVSLWTDAGVLLATKNVISVPGSWVETPLNTPVQLLAGQTYRLGFYAAGDSPYGRYDMPSLYPDATLQQAYYAPGDSFPNFGDSIHFAFVDIKYSAPILATVPTTPFVLGLFTNGVWSGNVTVQLPASNLILHATDALGHYGDSASFDVAPAPGQITHFAWSNISPPVSNGAPIAVSLTALDYFNNPASNYAGSPFLGALGVPGTSGFTLLNSPSNPASAFVTVATYGYAFTPNSDITVTHVRHYFGLRVSIWLDDGTLVVGKNVTSVPGTWVQTALDSPVVLNANTRYRIGVVVGGATHYWRNDMPGTFPHGTIDQGYFGAGNIFPNQIDPTRWAFVDFAYQINQAPSNLFISPTNASGFVNGVWNSNVFVLQEASAVSLNADDGLGHSGQSSSFDVGPAAGQATHFVWMSIPSPQLIGEQFPVTILAKDYLNGPATNFTGMVALSGLQNIQTTNSMFGNAVADNSYNNGTYTIGNSFTPGTNITVTHVRHYFGTKVSIWTDSGVLIASRLVTSVPGTWVETPLFTPISLLAGQTYRVGVYTAGQTYYGRFDQSSTFAHGTINQTYYYPDDVFPSYFDSWHWIFVDLKYTAPTNSPILVTPLLSGNFADGSWTGKVAVQQAATNVTLKAVDFPGNSAISAPFSVAPTPLLVMNSSSNAYEVSWPAAAAGFVLEQASSVTPPVVWTTCPNAPFLKSGRLCITNNLSNGAVFYRLRKL
jgi:uncharacterized repeat protein (TIGR01451 family)